jgi:hypothetical protein
MEGLNCQCEPSNHGTRSNFKTCFAGDDVSQSDWRRLVKIYSTKNFTQYQDTLPALEGIANRVRGAGRYIQGMWETWLLKDLAWYSLIESPNEPSTQYNGQGVRPYRISDSDSPSFSWSSVAGSKSYLDNISSISIKNECELLHIDIPTKSIQIKGKLLRADFVKQSETQSSTGSFVKHNSGKEQSLEATVRSSGIGPYIIHPDTHADVVEWANNESKARFVCLQLCSSINQSDGKSYGLVLMQSDPGNSTTSYYKRVGFVASLNKKDFERGGLEVIWLS